MQIDIRPKKLARLFRSDQPWAAISISTVPGEWPVLSTENRVDLLQLSFKDIEFAGRDGGITDEDARKILEFVDRNADKVDTLLIHCEMGVSRSPAVGAAVYHVLTEGGDDSEFFQRFTPNRIVYRTILDEARRQGRILKMM